LCQERPDGERNQGHEVRKREELEEKWLAHVKDVWRKTKETRDHDASTQKRK
jgi:hypothetical protein